MPQKGFHFQSGLEIPPSPLLGSIQTFSKENMLNPSRKFSLNFHKYCPISVVRFEEYSVMIPELCTSMQQYYVTWISPNYYMALIAIMYRSDPPDTEL